MGNIGVSSNIRFSKLPAQNPAQRVKRSEVEKLLKYVNDEAVITTPESLSSSAKSAGVMALLFEGIPFVKLLRRNKVLDGKFASASMGTLKDVLSTKQARTELFSGKGNFFKKLVNYVKSYDAGTEVFSKVKAEAAARVKNGKMTSVAYQGEIAKETGKAVANASPSIFGKIGSAFKAPFKAVGGAIAKKFPKFASACGKMNGFLKTSGTGVMMAMDGLFETFNVIVPTFKELGAEKGMKQVGKSAVKVVGNTAGYYLGAKAGAVVGSLICPGVGTFVGSVCGFVGGIIGSNIAGKLTDKMVGPSELDKAKEEQKQKMISKIARDPNAFNELKLAAQQKIQEEAMQSGGQLSDDSKLVANTLKNLDRTNPFVAVV